MEISVILIILAIILLATTNPFNIFDSIVIGDLFLRAFALALSFFTNNEIIKTIDSNIPDSLLEPIETWATGNLYIILIVIYVICYAAFLFTIIKRLVKRR